MSKRSICTFVMPSGSKCQPKSSSVLEPLAALHGQQAVTRFHALSNPHWHTGITWSKVAVFQVTRWAQYLQR